MNKKSHVSSWSFNGKFGMFFKDEDETFDVEIRSKSYQSRWKTLKEKGCFTPAAINIRCIEAFSLAYPDYFKLQPVIP